MDKEINWVREYNKLFQAINNQGTPEYFSGARFIDIVREFDPSFPDYGQFIAYRKKKGLNTSRKNYYYDILMMFKEDLRKQIINRIWEDVNPESTTKNHKIVESNKNSVNILNHTNEILEVEKYEPKTATEIISNPTVFISYSWDNEEHQNWVLKLATKLFDNGVAVLLDRYELGPGKNVLHFMETSIPKADKVIIVFTNNYKLKAENRKGGVGYEYSILNSELYRIISTNNKFLPVIRNGSIETSVPNFMQQFISVDMIDDSKFDENFNQLLLAIYDKPQIEKPKLGPAPKFKA